MVLMEFSMFPVGEGESLSRYVARSLEIIDQSGLDYQLHAMGTVVEGEIEEVLAVLKACHEAMATDCNRISCSVKLDYRKGKSGRLEEKVSSVQAKVDRPLKTAKS